jgi:hypothetical protein
MAVSNGQVAIWLGSNLLSLTSAAIVFLAWHSWSGAAEEESDVT